MEKKTSVRKLIILISCVIFVLVVIVFIVMHYSYQSQIGSTKQNPSRIKTIDQGGYQSLISRLEHDLPRIMDKVKIPGLSIALINNSGIIWHGNFGVKSIKTNSPIDDSTVFMAASFSKVVFTYYVLKMVDEGKLNLDTPLIGYAPKSYIEKEFLPG